MRIFAPLALAAMLMVASAEAQAPSISPERPAPEFIGLHIYSSDGQKLGQVTDAIRFKGEPILQAEFEAPLGFGATYGLITAPEIANTDGRVQLRLSAAEVRSNIARDAQP